MAITFDEAYQITRPVPGYYEEHELRRLYDLACQLPSSPTIVEIGVEYGRSASILMQCPGIAKASGKHHGKLWLIDARTHNAEEGRYSTNILVSSYGQLQNIRVIEMRSSVAWEHLRGAIGQIDLLHIDAAHTAPEVDFDYKFWPRNVRPDGFVVGHDYRRPGADPTTGSVFPDVDAAVDKYLSDPKRWEDLGVVGTQVARRRK